MPRLGGAYCFRRVRSQRKSVDWGNMWPALGGAYEWYAHFSSLWGACVQSTPFPWTLACNVCEDSWFTFPALEELTLKIFGILNSDPAELEDVHIPETLLQNNMPKPSDIESVRRWTRGLDKSEILLRRQCISCLKINSISQQKLRKIVFLKYTHTIFS